MRAQGRREGAPTSDLIDIGSRKARASNPAPAARNRNAAEITCPQQGELAPNRGKSCARNQSSAAIGQYRRILRTHHQTRPRSKSHLRILPGPDGIDCSRDPLSDRAQERKPVGGKLDDGDRAFAEVLLVAQILICSDEHVEQPVQPGEQSTVERARQSLLLDRRNRVI